MKRAAAALTSFLALILVYVVIMGVRLARIEREVAALDEVARERAPASEEERALER